MIEVMTLRERIIADRAPVLAEAKSVNDQLARAREEVARLSRLRTTLMRELYESGLKHREIGDELNISGPRVHQLLNGKDH